MKRIHGLDYRSIGFFRIALAIVVLFNLLSLKWRYFNSFFSVTKGFIPEPLFHNSVFKTFFSSDISTLVLFVVATLCAILLLVGYLSRLSVALLFIFYALYNSVFTHLSFGYDRYIEVILFLSIFLPLEARFAVTTSKDSLIKEVNFTRWPAYLILLQIGLIYTISGMAKNGIMWQNGTAVGVLLLDDLVAKPIAGELIHKSILVHVLSYATVLFEALGLFLLFSPWKNQYTRLLFCIFILSFHWGLSFFVNVGHFKWIGTAAVILVLPSLFWSKFNRLEKFLSQIEQIALPRWYAFNYSKILNSQFVYRAIGVLLLYCIVTSNLSMISRQGDAMGKFIRTEKLDKVLQSAAFNRFNNFSTVFNQNWYFYAPNPNIHLGKIYFVGVNYDGTQVNLETNKPYVEGDYSQNKNKNTLRDFFNSKLRSQVNKNANGEMTLEYAKYLVNTWEKENKEYLKAMECINFYFNGRKVMQGELKTIKKESIISVDLHQMRFTN